MPICKESGYALLTDRDEVLRFDARGNKLARELIEQRLNNHGWLVSIEGILEGDKLTVDRMRLR